MTFRRTHRFTISIKGCTGSAMIEMAIVLPLFISLLIAIVDFGLYFSERNVAQSAAYNAAKDCAASPSIAPSEISSMGITLDTMNLYDRLANSPKCGGTPSYSQVDLRISASMVSSFTRVIYGEQGFLVTGIASK